MEAQITDHSTDSPFFAEETQALSSLQNVVIAPPYDGGYRRLSFNPGPDAVFGSADRQYPQRHEIVAQLWNQKSADAYGWIESGLRREFEAQETGDHRILVQVAAGPVSRVNGAVPFMRAWIPGLGNTYGAVSSYRTSFMALNVHLEAGQIHRLFVMGGVSILTRRGWPPAYGEVIATFPRITAFRPAVLQHLDAVDQQLERALAEHDSPDAAFAALSAELEDGVIELT